MNKQAIDVKNHISKIFADKRLANQIKNNDESGVVKLDLWEQQLILDQIESLKNPF